MGQIEQIVPLRSSMVCKRLKKQVRGLRMQIHTGQFVPSIKGKDIKGVPLLPHFSLTSP